MRPFLWGTMGCVLLIQVPLAVRAESSAPAQTLTHGGCGCAGSQESAASAGGATSRAGGGQDRERIPGRIFSPAVRKRHRGGCQRRQLCFCRGSHYFQHLYPGFCGRWAGANDHGFRAYSEPRPLRTLSGTGLWPKLKKAFAKRLCWTSRAPILPRRRRKVSAGQRKPSWITAR